MTKAGWRAISRSLVRSKKWKRASNEARVVWLAIVLECDGWGRIEADPEDLLDRCFPNQHLWTTTHMRAALTELDGLCLAQLYTDPDDDDRPWLQIEDWDSHQPREFLRKRGRCKSPEPPPRGGERRTCADLSENPCNTEQGRPTPPLEVEVRDRRESLTGLSSDYVAHVGPTEKELEATKLNEQVAAVFEHWAAVQEHAQLPPRGARTFPPGIRSPKLTAGRSSHIRARLKEGYSVEDLCRSVTGFLSDPWHLGDNDRDTRFTDIPTIMKKASKVDAGLVKWEQLQAANRAKSNGTSLVRPQAVTRV